MKRISYLVKKRLRSTLNLSGFFCFCKNKTASRFTFHTSRGFTLVEVLVSIMILAVGLVMVIEVMGRTQQALRISRNLVVASQLAEEQIVQLEMDTREDNELRSGTEKGDYELPGREFEVTTKVEPFYDEALVDDTQINKVNVDISWRDGPTRVGGLNLTTLIANRIEMEELEAVA